MILTGQAIAQHFPDLPREQINATSVDVRLQSTILLERPAPTRAIDTRRPTQSAFMEVEIPERGLYLAPGDFFLGATVEVLDMRPYRNLSADFQLKSSIGRMGLEHMMAGWIEPEFSGTVTLELKNNLKHNSLLIYPNMLIGQIKFFKHDYVDPEFSYATKGRYMGQTKPRRSAGVR